MAEEFFVDRQTLVDAKDVLHKGHGGDSFSRLMDCLCILMQGVLERAIEEYDDDVIPD